MLRVCIAAIVLAAGATPAAAYEFWLRAQTIGQEYELREYRLVGPDLFLGRRRATQTLALRIWDIGDLVAARRRARLQERGPRVSWQSYLRVDHDFGLYTAGRIRIAPGTRRDAIDVIPELAGSAVGLELLYGYLEVAGLGGDRATLRVGRVLVDDGWGASGVDGGSARIALGRATAIGWECYLGVEYDDSEELKGAEKTAERDRKRWELDPVSSEDYRERMRKRR